MHERYITKNDIDMQLFKSFGIDFEILVNLVLTRIVAKIHRTTVAKVTAELNHHLNNPICTKKYLS